MKKFLLLFLLLASCHHATSTTQQNSNTLVLPATFIGTEDLYVGGVIQADKHVDTVRLIVLRCDSILNIIQHNGFPSFNDTNYYQCYSINKPANTVFTDDQNSVYHPGDTIIFNDDKTMLTLRNFSSTGNGDGHLIIVHR